MRSRRSNSGCSSCGSGGTTRARSVRARQSNSAVCGTVTVEGDENGGGGDPGGNGGGDGDGLSREALIGGAAVAGLGIAYVASRN